MVWRSVKTHDTKQDGLAVLWEKPGRRLSLLSAEVDRARICSATGRRGVGGHPDPNAEDRDADGTDDSADSFGDRERAHKSCHDDHDDADEDLL